VSAPLKHRRKIALATWRAPQESRIHAKITVDLTAILEFLESKKHLSLTLTHLVGGALARAIESHPEVNGRVLFGRVRNFPRIDICFAVDIDDGTDLAQCRVTEANKKTLQEIQADLARGAERLRARLDEGYRRTAG
jgi:pyruvate/2-oxoglutarate dehydrogenase complex dihydrolipoamide acyltransferase (E2) component